MPIYEYECFGCGHHTEVLQKFSDPPIAECEECHGKMKKLISHSSFHLKGTGWYVTDYASKSDGKEKSNSSSDNKVAGKEKVTSNTDKKDTKVETSSSKESKETPAPQKS